MDQFDRSDDGTSESCLDESMSPSTAAHARSGAQSRRRLAEESINAEELEILKLQIRFRLYLWFTINEVGLSCCL